MGLIRPLAVKPLGDPGPNARTASRKVTARVDTQYNVGHPLALPLYAMPCTEAGNWRSIDYRPGRVLLGTHGQNPAQPEPLDKSWLRADLAEFVCTQDVLFAPLYEGTMRKEGPWPLAPRRTFEHNVEVLTEVAPQVRAVLWGNRYAEFGRLDVFAGLEEEHAWMSVAQCAEMVEEGGNLIRSLGGRPAVGLVDLQILVDCYRSPGWVLREALIAVDALVICFLGFKFYDHMVTLKEGDGKEVIIPRGLVELPPYPLLRDWLSGLECWSGMDYLDGLHKGNDVSCAEGGWAAGVVGQLPDGTR